MIMPTIAPGRKMIPVVFVASISGMRALCSAVFKIGVTAWRLVAPRARAASTLSRCSARSSRMRVIVRLAAFMEFPITIPPSGIKYRAVAGTTPSASSNPSVATAATPTATAATTKALGTSSGPARRGPRREEDHSRQQKRDRPYALQPEDEIYDVAYRGELHEGADDGDADLLLQVQPLVQAQYDRDRHEPERQQSGPHRLQPLHPRASPR